MQFKPIPPECKTLRWVQIVSLLIVAVGVAFVVYTIWFLYQLGPLGH